MGLTNDPFDEYVTYIVTYSLHMIHTTYSLLSAQTTPPAIFGRNCNFFCSDCLKEKKPQRKCMFRLGDDDIESPYKKFLDTFDFFV